MLNLLTEPNKYPQFTEVIQKHFFLQKDKIKEVCKKWVDCANDKLRDDYQDTYAKLVIELDKLNFNL